ncbi:hypothetical protein NIES2104_23580 [Leptolyngbya sp. NIES-2104]|nr:hypothetical protein NIES2104_23580 [Leptolyngbya sp. NIES-2104]
MLESKTNQTQSKNCSDSSKKHLANVPQSGTLRVFRSV